MATVLEYLKPVRQPHFLDKRKGRYCGAVYNPRMVKAPPRHDWHLVEWCKHFGKKQADLVTALDWNPSKASLFWRGEQRYHRDDVNDVAAFLGLHPYELLLTPDEANAIKRLRATARQLAAVDSQASDPQPLQAKKA
jgi:hypothetical protein